MGNCAAMRDLDSNSGPETPVPVLLLSRGCLSTPSSRLGPGASTLGLSAIPFGNQYRHSVVTHTKSVPSVVLSVSVVKTARFHGRTPIACFQDSQCPQ